MREVVEGAELGFVDELKNPVPAGLGDVMRHERRISCPLKREALRAALEDTTGSTKCLTVSMRHIGRVLLGSSF